LTRIAAAVAAAAAVAVGEIRKIIGRIVNRKKNWIGHILRGDGLLKDVMEGRMEGREQEEEEE